MRVTADVYDTLGNKTGTGPVLAIKSASVTEQLDGAGTFSLDLAVDERVLTLINDAEVRVNVQTYDNQPSMEWVRGIIRDNEIQDQESGTSITVSGPDTMDALTERTVGIGRSYDAQTMGTIINSLVGIVPGWSTTIESAVAGDLQSTRFDGANVLQALLRCTSEKGIHVRNGLTANTLEIGAFGSPVVNANGVAVRAIKAPSEPSIELQQNDTTIFIDRISRSSKSDDVVNWCIPIGAGEGSAALTLKDTTYAIYDGANGSLWRAGTASKYPIYRQVNANGIVEYFIFAGAATDRLRQAVVSFKEIGPISNNDSAKQLAANALVQAAMAYLDRQKIPLVTYKFSAKNVQTHIRPGDKLPVEYQGRMEIIDETRSSRPRVTYMEVDDTFWVLKVTKRISADSITHDFDVATVDRYAMDTTKIVVSMMEAMQARNVSVQTFPTVFQDSDSDVIQGGFTASSAHKNAEFSFSVDEIFTDVISVKIRVITKPLYVLAGTGLDNQYGSSIHASDYWFSVQFSPNYPSDITITIDGVDATTALDGPWNPSAGNSPIDVTLDITNYIVNAPGGLYQDHQIVFIAGSKSGDAVIPSTPAHNSYPSGDVSHGIVKTQFIVLGTARAIVPATA